MNKDVLSTLLAQELDFQFDKFNNDIAWKLGVLLTNSAKKDGSAVSIEIYAFGQTLFSYSLAGTSADNHTWVKRKRQSVLRFGHSSLYLSKYNELKGRDFERLPHIDSKEYCVHGGAFPIRIKDSGLIGSITVSGLSQQEDHDLIIKNLNELLSKEP